MNIFECTNCWCALASQSGQDGLSINLTIKHPNHITSVLTTDSGASGHGNTAANSCVTVPRRMWSKSKRTIDDQLTKQRIYKDHEDANKSIYDKGLEKFPTFPCTDTFFKNSSRLCQNEKNGSNYNNISSVVLRIFHTLRKTFATIFSMYFTHVNALLHFNAV